MPKERTLIIPSIKPFRPRSVRNESAEECLARVEKRLPQIQCELDEWITVPTKYGILITHKLEDEKQLMLRMKALLKEEVTTGKYPYEWNEEQLRLKVKDLLQEEINNVKS